MGVLIGVPIVVLGFALRFNALLVVTIAGIATGIAGGLHTVEIISAFGKAFADNRYMGLIWLTLPVIALLERNGLKEQARNLISRLRAATTGRVLMLYFVIRQITAALGLTSLGGHAQMVRPLIAPMAEGAAENRFGKISDAVRFRLREFSAATDNVGLFFGEDVFVAFGAIVLMTTFLKEAGIVVEPLHVAVWGIPTAICAFLVHGFRLWLFDRRLNKELGALTKNVAVTAGSGSGEQA